MKRDLNSQTYFKQAALNLRVVLLGIIISNNPLWGQTKADSLVLMPTIEVVDEKTRFSPVGVQTQSWKREYLEKCSSNNLGDLLFTETGAFVKSYGQGSLSTSSVRGGSAGHTLVLWNGLPIQNPMLGQLDLSLLPIQVFDQVNFQLGGNSSMLGSGAVAGTVNLSSNPEFENRTHVSSEIQVGQFGYLQQFLKLETGNERIQSTTRFLYRQADNDFPYEMGEGIDDRIQSNAGFIQRLFTQDLSFKLSGKQQLGVNIWHQNSHRQIPPTNVQRQSSAWQDDLSNRVMLQYKLNLRNSITKAKAGYFSEQLNYQDDLSGLVSPSSFNSFIAEFSVERWIGLKHKFLFGNTTINTTAFVDEYSGGKAEQYRSAFFGAWEYRSSKFSSNLSLRYEHVDGSSIPILPSLGIEYELLSSLFFTGRVGRDFRVPTLNDRYWRPGGNPDLLPESGWSQEFGFRLQGRQSQLLKEASITAFNRNIDNWILWGLSEESFFWSASNLAAVWSRGIELRSTLAIEFDESTLSLQAGYDYIKSTNEIALNSPKLDAGDQLWYTPVHQGHISMHFEWKGLRFSYQQTFTGATKGINEDLESFDLAVARIQYAPLSKTPRFTLFLNVYNIWDKEYFILERRPMPGRNITGGLRITI